MKWPCDLVTACETENDAKEQQSGGDAAADDAAGQHVVINVPCSLPGYRKIPEKN